MVSFVQSVVSDSRVFRLGPCLMAAALAVLAGGCSADIARFDFASANLNDPGTTGAIPTPPEPVHGRSNLIGKDEPSAPPQQAADGAYIPPRSDRAPAVTSAPLADTATPSPGPSPYDRPAESQRPLAVAALPPETSRPAAQPAPMVEHAEISKGEQIEVQQGDTFYGLAKRHRVSITDLMAVNDLKSPNLKLGQKLYVPATRTYQTPDMPSPAPALTADAANWTSAYTVKPGDSLYGIAVRHRLKSADIQRNNGIQDVRKIKPGMVLKMPAGSGDGTVGMAVAPQPAVTAELAPQQAPAPRVPVGGPVPKILNDASASAAPATAAPATALSTAPGVRDEQRTAAIGPIATAPSDAASGSASPPGSGSAALGTKLRWPAEGKIISGFGKRVDGTHNDGVNVAVPLGTDIHAAEAGTVAYAGDELKDYGKLVLVRHDNGWVTAYAHAEDILVKRGDAVKRGQVIAKAGKSGQVDQPQLHFELRQGQKPIDPTPYMEKM